jgi:hypothetical protein
VIHQEGSVKRGTVWIAWDEGRYSGYWDLEPEGSPTHLEQMPDCVSAWEAIDWGRPRANRIMIRPKSDPGQYYWAGMGPPPGQPPIPIYQANEAD